MTKWAPERKSPLGHFWLLLQDSKKSLGSGVPIVSIFFPAAMIGAVILPLMLVHQIQIMVCAVLARDYASRAEAT